MGIVFQAYAQEIVAPPEFESKNDSGAEEGDEGFWNVTQILYVDNLAVPALPNGEW